MTINAQGLFMATGKVPTEKASRKEHDFYATPPEVTHAVLLAERDELSHASGIYDPACGDGAVVAAADTWVGIRQPGEAITLVCFLRIWVVQDCGQCVTGRMGEAKVRAVHMIPKKGMAKFVPNHSVRGSHANWRVRLHKGKSQFAQPPNPVTGCRGSDDVLCCGGIGC